VYIFDVITVQTCSGATGADVVRRIENWGYPWRSLLRPLLGAGRHVRHWTLRDIYPEGEHPIAFPHNSRECPRLGSMQQSRVGCIDRVPLRAE
jgi:hypothetical protein